MVLDLFMYIIITCNAHVYMYRVSNQVTKGKHNIDMYMYIIVT